MSKPASRNPLESPWALGEAEFMRRVRKTSEVSKTSEVWKAYQSAREETMALTEETAKVEQEIDERVKGLYGL
jgi:carboxylesterase type B